MIGPPGAAAAHSRQGLSPTYSLATETLLCYMNDNSKWPFFEKLFSPWREK